MLIRTKPGAQPARKRGKCVYCGKTFSLNGATGFVRKHYIIAGPTTLQPGERVVCGGAGRGPR